MDYIHSLCLRTYWMSRWALDVTRLSSFCLAAAVGGALLLSSWGQAKEAQVSKDMEELRSQEPDSPVFKYLEQVCVGLIHAKVHVSIYVYVHEVHGTYLHQVADPPSQTQTGGFRLSFPALFGWFVVHGRLGVQ